MLVARMLNSRRQVQVRKPGPEAGSQVPEARVRMQDPGSARWVANLPDSTSLTAMLGPETPVSQERKPKTLDVGLPGLGHLALESPSAQASREEGVKLRSPFVLGTSACIPPWNFPRSYKAWPAAKSYIHCLVARQRGAPSGKTHNVVTVSWTPGSRWKKDFNPQLRGCLPHFSPEILPGPVFTLTFQHSHFVAFCVGCLN